MTHPTSERILAPLLLQAFVLLPSSLTIAWLASVSLGLSQNAAAFIGILWLTIFYAKFNLVQPTHDQKTEPHE
ncbi:MAG TPA: hypothetical protein VN397_03180 [Candidatus Methylomirabilis sp.]|nr:hypothetical protein [Candidatus Methylomirabilis sp.]